MRMKLGTEVRKKNIEERLRQAKKEKEEAAQKIKEERVKRIAARLLEEEEAEAKLLQEQEEAERVQWAEEKKQGFTHGIMAPGAKKREASQKALTPAQEAKEAERRKKLKYDALHKKMKDRFLTLDQTKPLMVTFAFSEAREIQACACVCQYWRDVVDQFKDALLEDSDEEESDEESSDDDSSDDEEDEYDEMTEVRGGLRKTVGPRLVDSSKFSMGQGVFSDLGTWEERNGSAEVKDVHGEGKGKDKGQTAAKVSRVAKRVITMWEEKEVGSAHHRLFKHCVLFVAFLCAAAAS